MPNLKEFKMKSSSRNSKHRMKTRNLGNKLKEIKTPNKLKNKVFKNLNKTYIE